MRFVNFVHVFVKFILTLLDLLIKYCKNTFPQLLIVSIPSFYKGLLLMYMIIHTISMVKMSSEAIYIKKNTLQAMYFLFSVRIIFANISVYIYSNVVFNAFPI